MNAGFDASAPATIMSAPFISIPNFRDLGGLPVAGGGRVRHGRLYRSEALDEVDSDDLQRLGSIEVSLVCDLRGARERAASPHRLPTSWSAALLVAESALDVAAADLVQAFIRDDAASASRAEAYMLQTYRALPRTFAPLLARLFSCLLDSPAPVLISCAAGKDRTGFVCAVLLHALGVDSDAIVADYMASDRHFGAERISKRLRERSGREPATAVVNALRVRTEYLEAALDAAAKDFGSVDRYLTICGKLDAPRRELLAQSLVEM